MLKQKTEIIGILPIMLRKLTSEQTLLEYRFNLLVERVEETFEKSTFYFANVEQNSWDEQMFESILFNQMEHGVNACTLFIRKEGIVTEINDYTIFAIKSEFLDFRENDVRNLNQKNIKIKGILSVVIAMTVKNLGLDIKCYLNLLVEKIKKKKIKNEKLNQDSFYKTYYFVSIKQNNWFGMEMLEYTDLENKEGKLIGNLTKDFYMNSTYHAKFGLQAFTGSFLDLEMDILIPIPDNKELPRTFRLSLNNFKSQFNCDFLNKLLLLKLLITIIFIFT